MYRVETTIADEIAESLFVDFNGKMHILVRAYRNTYHYPPLSSNY